MFGGILVGMYFFVRNFRSNFNDTINTNANRMREVQEERKRTQRSPAESNPPAL